MITVIDRRCRCEDCEPRIQETYDLSCKCANCGERHIARFRKGERHGVMDACPHCGVLFSLVYGTSAEAAEWQELEAQ
jgi:predicted RNA-binding Zn-ribbon protein involved in translation (DUF1610 family)